MFHFIARFNLLVCIFLFLFSLSCIPTLRPDYVQQHSSQVAPPPTPPAAEEEEELDEEEIDQTAMPYDIRLDTMALLTCDSSNIPGENFKFRAGAFLQEIDKDGGGIKLKSSFRKIDRDTLKEYPYYNTTPAMFFGSASEGLLSTSSILSNIQLKNYTKKIDDGDYVHQFGSRDLDFRFPLPKVSPRNLDQFFRTPAIATFVPRGTNTPAVYLDDLQDQEIHGKSYEIDLEKRESFFVLNSIKEEDLLNSKKNDWACEYSFTVYRHETLRYDGDANAELGCDQDNKENKSLYELARILLGDDWFIDTENFCISPKNRRQTCYGANPERVEFSNNCRGIHKGYHCPHYFSICTINEIK